MNDVEYYNYCRDIDYLKKKYYQYYYFIALIYCLWMLYLFFSKYLFIHPLRTGVFLLFTVLSESYLKEGITINDIKNFAYL